MGKLSLQKLKLVLPSTLHNSLFLKLISSLILTFLLVAPLDGQAINPVKAGDSAQLVGNGSWDTLTSVQKQALTPLVAEWDRFTPENKQKWLSFAVKFQQMKPEEQKRAQEKMQTWAKLSPEQRFAARENYLRSNKLQPDLRNQKWQEYQQLTDEQKAQLANHPEKKKLITNLPTPAESKEKKLQPLKSPQKTVNNPLAKPATSPSVPTPGGQSAAPSVKPAVPTPILPQPQIQPATDTAPSLIKN